MAGKGKIDWETSVRIDPTPAAVLKLLESHGIEACLERWSWLLHKTIWNRYDSGKRARARIEVQRNGS